MAEVTDVTNLAKITKDKMDYIYSQIKDHMKELDFNTSEHIQFLDDMESVLLKLQKRGSNHRNYQCNNILNLIQLAHIRIPKSDVAYEHIRLHRAQMTISSINAMLTQYYLTEPQYKESITEIMYLTENAYRSIQMNGEGEIDTLRCFKYLEEAEDLLKNL